MSYSTNRRARVNASITSRLAALCLVFLLVTLSRPLQAAPPPVTSPSPAKKPAVVKPLPSPAPAPAKKPAVVKPLPSPAPAPAKKPAVVKPLPLPAPVPAKKPAVVKPLPSPAPAPAKKPAVVKPLPSPAPAPAKKPAVVNPLPSPAPARKPAVVKPLPSLAPARKPAVVKPLPSLAPAKRPAVIKPLPSLAPAKKPAVVKPLPSLAPAKKPAVVKPGTPSTMRPQLLVQDGHSSLVTGLCFNGNGSLLASVSIDGGARLWEVATGRVLHTFDLDYVCRAVALSPDGRTVVTGGPAGRIDVWKTDTGRLEQSLSGRRSDVVALAFSPDGTRLAVADTVAVAVWSIATARSLISFERGKEVTTSLAWSPDGKLLAIRSRHHTAVWNPQDTRAPMVLTPPPGGDVGFGDRGGLLLAGTAVCETATGRILLSPRTETEGVFSCLAPDGRFMVIASRKEIQTLSIPSGTLLASQPSDGLSAMAMAPDGGVVAVAPLWPMGRIQLLSTTEAGPARFLDGRSERVSSVLFTADGRTLVARSLEGSVVLWDLATGRPRQVLAQAESSLSLPPLPVASERNLLAVAYPRHVDVWDLEGQRILTTVKGSGFRAVGLTPDRKHVITGEAHGRVMVWDVDGNPIADLKPAANTSVADLAISPDGKTLALACGMAVEEWDLASRKMVTRHQMGDLAASPVAIAFTPDGLRLASVSRDGAVRLVRSRNEASPDLLCEVPGVPLFSVVFSADGALVAAGGRKKAVLVDLATRKVVARLPGGHGGFHSLAFSPDRRCLVSAGWGTGSTIRFWEVPSGKALGYAAELDGGKEWLVATPDGLFDSSPLARKLLQWRVGERTHAMDQLFNEYFTPGLLQRLLLPAPREGARPVARTNLGRLGPAPRVAISSPRGGAKVGASPLAVSVDVADQGGGASDIRLYRNGHRLPDSRATRSASGATFTVDLLPGKNSLRATAFDRSGRVESRGDQVVVWAPEQAGGETRLFVLAVGVDRYQCGLGLKSAVSDARSVASFFKPGLFSQVRATCLGDAQATRAGVLDALAAIAKEAAPQDALVVYLAGHGTLLGEVFHYLPQDVRITTDDDIRQTSLSTVEIGEALTRISAARQVLILDACHAEASAPTVGSMLARRDSIALIRSQQRLARSSGCFLIATSTAEKDAHEVPELGHGILTYAILSGLGESGAPRAATDPSGQVTVNALLQYLLVEVPRLTEKHHGARREVVEASTDHDFPLVVTPGKR